MTYTAHRYVIAEGPQWWLNRLGHPTRHLETAQMWLTKKEAESVRANYARLNPKNEFRVEHITSDRPDGEWGPGDDLFKTA